MEAKNLKSFQSKKELVKDSIVGLKELDSDDLASLVGRGLKNVPNKKWHVA